MLVTKDHRDEVVRGFAIVFRESVCPEGNYVGLVTSIRPVYPSNWLIPDANIGALDHF
ncbi:hypothetical protein HFX_5074 (plasmid) [Haloferax mediterranei ATCC 33500]|uniref:Uncharacterized protein n=1 Tax=Haloferax mediterranei (strain ATCC 33500 / DSM 1411 / JCM 8866 / NBRC 14739 / NCIMB 2177 / R-4) TaxID=523841 RepID=I3R9K0_HALMT|nr:hypothetical protein HFX_5074 [Haloferax mediterranei ATCC 33500]